MAKTNRFGSYTIVGLRPDGVAPVMDLQAALSDIVPASVAATFLREHLSCSAVEIWREDSLLITLERADLKLST